MPATQRSYPNRNPTNPSRDFQRPRRPANDNKPRRSFNPANDNRPRYTVGPRPRPMWRPFVRALPGFILRRHPIGLAASFIIPWVFSQLGNGDDWQVVNCGSCGFTDLGPDGYLNGNRGCCMTSKSTGPAAPPNDPTWNRYDEMHVKFPYGSRPWFVAVAYTLIGTYSGPYTPDINQPVAFPVPQDVPLDYPYFIPDIEPMTRPIAQPTPEPEAPPVRRRRPKPRNDPERMPEGHTRTYGKPEPKPLPRQHTPRRPPPGTKERKYKIALPPGVVKNALNFVTESVDMLNVLYDSLPADRQTCSKGDEVCMFNQVYRHHDEIIFEEFVHNFFGNQNEDFIFGKLGGINAHASWKAGFGPGFQTGPAL